MKKLTKSCVIVTLLLTNLITTNAFSDQGDLLIRLRGLSVVPEVSATDTLDAINSDLNNDLIPELDFTYMVTNNIGIELILGTSRHKLTSDLGDLGKVSVLPPTLTLQYHFMPQATFRPYVGVGINYTRFYHNDLHVGDTNVDIDENSFGLAAQAGFDVAINKNWFVNFDIKKIQMDTKASMAGTNLGKLTIDPWVFGIGIGTKF